MGKTIPSFRIVLAEEKAKWKPFRNALDKKEKKFLKKCGTFLNYSSLLALALFSWRRFILSLYRFCSIITKSWRNAFLKLNGCEKVNDERQEEY
jgi:hypothetical protein